MTFKKNNIFKKIMPVIFIVLIGCGSSKSNLSNINIDPSENSNVDQLISMLPERDDIQQEIMNYISVSNNAPRKITSNPQSTFFGLSKIDSMIDGKYAALKMQFIVIENIDSIYEKKYTGTVIFSYEYKLNNTGEYEWVKGQNTEVIFESFDTGSISGKVELLSVPAENIFVYGISGEEQTKIAKTDSNGDFIIEDVLTNDYIIHAYTDIIPEATTREVTVYNGITSNAGLINIIPGVNASNTSVFGQVFFDIDNNVPAPNVNVWLEENGVLVNKVVKTDINGRFIIPEVEVYEIEKNYQLNLKIDKNEKSDVIVTVNTSNSGDFIDTGKLLIQNTIPMITEYSPEYAVELEIGKSQEFYIHAEDTDGQELVYEWSCDSGNIAANKNKCIFTPSISDKYILKALVNDNYGGIKAHEFFIISGNLIEFEDYKVKNAVSSAIGSSMILDTYLNELYYLNISAREINNISDISKLDSLEYLNASNNDIQNISPLYDLENMKEIDLSDNQITDISGLNISSGCILNVEGNEINANQIATYADSGVIIFSDIVIFKDTVLETAVRTAISQNEGDILITTLDSISELSITNTQLSDLTGIQSLKKILNLDLSNNNITDISCLIANPGMESGATVNLTGNNITDDQIRSLRDKDVNVIY